MFGTAHAGPYREPAPLPSTRLVPPPVRARRIAVGLTGAFVAFVVFTLVSPWQQNVRGGGRVIAYAPLERRQNVEAPVGGRVVEWFVQEGSVVAVGDPIVRISDNDPQLMERLGLERDATAERLRNYEASVEAQRARLEAVTRGQASSVASYDARVRAAQQSVEASDQREQAADAALDTATLNLARQRALSEQGLASVRDRELAELAWAQARTNRDSARARARASRDELTAKRAELERARADRESAIESARTSLQSYQSDAANARAALARLDVRISRQEAQLVTASRAGTIFRLVANQGGDQVSAGDTLAVLVPDTVDRAVELWVDGNDAAIIAPGRDVRLQFEGWPAVQFAGWPSVAVGTFGGRVAFVDSTDDGRGNFRVVVVPDPDDEPWPSTRFLRQGVRANGWVLLERVSVGFELWRQLNGFPPVLDSPPSTDPGAGSYSSPGYGGGGYGGGDSYGEEGGYGDEGDY
ncbi:MAG: HlyD family efflux transporter periplasmic adaptor subunit [Sandaracinaceae bacterium]|nr:HlyD family efflux transporter periplasmic adaptor subunit [Sandaracinaceae bacterium]